MAQKTRTELKIQNAQWIKPNGIEAITGGLLGTHLDDFLDSVDFIIDEIAPNVYLVTQKFTNPTIVGNNTTCTILYTPSNDISVFINGLKYPVGYTNMSEFYFVDSGDLTTVKTKGTVAFPDTLFYNSAILEFTLASTDIIEIQYITNNIS